MYGETILHISVLYANDKVAMYIGDTYPELISCQYTKQPYLGTWPLSLYFHLLTFFCEQARRRSILRSCRATAASSSTSFPRTAT